MATSTPRLGLRKPGVTDLVSVQADLNDNYDKIEAEADRLDALIKSGDPIYTEVRAAAAIRVSPNVHTAVPYDTVIENPSTLWNIANNTRLTVPKAGLWRFTCGMEWYNPSSAAFTRMCKLRANGAGLFFGTSCEAAPNFETAMQAEKTFRLAIGGFVEMLVFHNQSADQDTTINKSYLVAEWVKA